MCYKKIIHFVTYVTDNILIKVYYIKIINKARV